MSGDSLDPKEEVEKLREELQRVQISKYELLRSTSAEIDRLRQTIKFLTGKADIQSIASIRSGPLNSSEVKYVINRVNTNHPSIDFETYLMQQEEQLRQRYEQTQFTQARGSTDESNNNNNNNTNSNNNNTNQNNNSNTSNQNNNINDRSEYNNSNNSNRIDNNENNIDNNNNEQNNSYDNNRENSSDNRLSTIHEDPNSMSDESNEHNNNNSNNNNNNSDNKDDRYLSINNSSHNYRKTEVITLSSSGTKINDRASDSSYRLSIKRMSRQGFVFSDLGFMTTDFEQLQRGHTQWVNHVVHHSIQNGICISASNDSCLFFWRFRESTVKESLLQEKYDNLLSRYKHDHNQQRAIINEAKANKPNIQPIHTAGEIKLHPLLKINTGLQIKGIAMSSNGVIIACICYDDEEEDNDPELELYYDEEQLWKFEQDFNNSLHSTTMSNKKSQDRTIHRKVIGLPFPPIDRGIAFTNDNKYVFIGLESSKQIIDEMSENEEDDKEENDQYDSKQNMAEACTLVCVDVTTKMVRPCHKINELMCDDEHVKCFSISPDGQRIAIGTSLGRLIVTGVRALTGASAEPDGNENASLWRIWIDEENVNNFNNLSDGALSAICWSADCEWLITGYYSGSIKLWKKNKEPRLSINVNKVVSIMMKRANVPRKSKIFTCKWMLEGLHVEAVNSFSIQGSLLISGSDDGTIIIHDLCQTFIDDNTPLNINNLRNNNNNNGNNSNSNNSNGSEDGSSMMSGGTNIAPSTLAKIERLHGGRMVTSVGLSRNCMEDSVLVPTAGLFMVSSGADNIIHCLSVMGVLRNSIRSKFYNQKL